MTNSDFEFYQTMELQGVKISPSYIEYWEGYDLEGFAKCMFAAAHKLPKPEPEVHQNIWYSQRGLADALGVSQTRVRHAVRRLLEKHKHSYLPKYIRSFHGDPSKPQTEPFLRETLALAVVADLADRYPRVPKAIQMVKVGIPWDKAQGYIPRHHRSDWGLLKDSLGTELAAR